MKKMFQKILFLSKDVVNYDNFFIKKKENLSIKELSELINIKNLQDLNCDDRIFDVKTLEEARENEVTFLSNGKYAKYLETTRAGFCFIQEKFREKLNKNTKAIVVDNPHYAYTILLDYLFLVPLFVINVGISEKAHISSSAKIGDNVEIQAGAFLGENVVIGNNCKICANAVINHNVEIGDDVFIGANTTISYAKIANHVIIQNNVSIGNCGFGFAHDRGFNYKIPQIGIVEIKDNVEIYAGATIARGSFNNTIIGNNSKIDSLCQMAHGVQIDTGCFFAAQNGIAGSTKIGKFCQFGGKSGAIGHLNIGNFVMTAGQSLIMKDIKDGERLGGTPAKNITDWHKETILLKKMVKKGKKYE